MNGVKVIDSMEETLGKTNDSSNLDELDELLSEILEESQGNDKSVISNSSRKDVNLKKSLPKPIPSPVQVPQASEENNRSFEDNTFEDDLDIEVLSSIPSDFNDDDHIFHMNLLRDSIEDVSCMQKKFSSSHKNATFSKERVREIAVENHFLLQKIMKHQVAQSAGSKRTANKPSNYFNHEYLSNAGKRTSSAINRKKQQSKIDYENAILLKKLETIRRKRKPNFP